MSQKNRFSLDLKISFLIFALSLAVYSLTLAPSVVTLFDDSLEFQLITYRLGIAHPTGYPLYTLLGKLFTLIPIGNIAFRVNFMSAFFAALTVAWLYQLIITYPTSPLPLSSEERGNSPSPQGRGIGGRKISALSAAMLFALSPIFWQQATIAEVYSLNAWFVALILWAARQETKSKITLLSVAALLGVSLTHHRTTVLLIPALAVYFLMTPSTRTALKAPRLWLELLLAGTVPLLLYLYIPLRGHIGSLDGTYQNTWAGFWQQVTASGYGSTFLLANPFNENRPMSFYLELLYQQFGWLTWLGILGGIYQLWQRRYAHFALINSSLLTYTLFNLLYHVADIEVFFMPVFLLWAVWIGLGLMAIGHGVTYIVNYIKPHRSLRPVRFSAAIIIGLLVSTQLYQSTQATLPILQARNTWHIHDYGLDILQQPLPDQANIIGIVGEITLIRYFQQTVGLRPDLQPQAADAEPLRWSTLETALAQQPTAYLTQQAALLHGLPQRWSLSAVGPLVEVKTQPTFQPPVLTHLVNQPVTPAIKLVGYEVSRLPHTGTGHAPIRLSLWWQATQPISVNLQISARLLSESGDVVSVMDTIPVHFAYPTTTWRVGEIVADVYDLPINAPGHYTPLLIWYDPANNAAEVGRVTLPSINFR